MKFLKSKLFMGIVCFAVAILVGFVGIPVVNNVTNKKVSAVRFKENVAKGSIITLKNLELVQVPPIGLPTDVITDVKEVTDKYAVADAQIGDYVTKNRLSSTHPYANNYLFELPMGKVAISFSVKTFAAGLSGKILHGDIISLMSVVGDVQNAATADDVIAENCAGLAYLKVLAATSAEGDDTDGEKKDADNKMILPATITVMASTEQARLITGLEQKGNIQIALAARGDEDYAKELLAMQDDYFVQLAEQRLADEKKAEEALSVAEPTPYAVALPVPTPQKEVEKLAK
ncbi:MAG: RcpC/CpaB family pilus assembly protein [Hydrogenoanaerobacterium sp.]